MNLEKRLKKVPEIARHQLQLTSDRKKVRFDKKSDQRLQREWRYQQIPWIGLSLKMIHDQKIRMDGKWSV